MEKTSICHLIIMNFQIFFFPPRVDQSLVTPMVAPQNILWILLWLRHFLKCTCFFFLSSIALTVWSADQRLTWFRRLFIHKPLKSNFARKGNLTPLTSPAEWAPRLRQTQLRTPELLSLGSHPAGWKYTTARWTSSKRHFVIWNSILGNAGEKELTSVKTKTLFTSVLKGCGRCSVPTKGSIFFWK